MKKLLAVCVLVSFGCAAVAEPPKAAKPVRMIDTDYVRPESFEEL